VFFGITDKRVFELKYLNLIGLARVAIPTGDRYCQKKLLFYILFWKLFTFVFLRIYL
jgi:hypothetical protein